MNWVSYNRRADEIFPDEPTASGVAVRVATEPWELAQIHRLNYATFVEEIPQHAPDPSRLRVDPFHDDNTYLIAVRARQVVAMVAIHDQRPFSLDLKLGSVDQYLAPVGRCCELRLLSVVPGARSGRVLPRLLAAVWRHCNEQRYDKAIISATTRQLKLYRHLGFESFGPLVGDADARFQPMVITRGRAQTTLDAMLRRVPGC
jgi:hypothetical protein